MKYISVSIICLLFYPLSVFAGERLIIKHATKEVVLTGYTRAKTSQIISSEISGRVLRVNYETGDTIGDDVFIEIDPTFTIFQIQSTLHSLEQLEIAIQKARSRVTFLQKESSRIEKLLMEDMVTESRRDAIVQDLDQAGLALQAAIKEQSVLRTTLDELRERKSRHHISAPHGWVVTDREVEVNEIVQPGTRLAEVSDYRELVVPLSVSSEELSSIMSLPDNFEARLEGNPVKASIHWINPQFDEKTRKLNIAFIIKHYNRSMRGGLKLTLPVDVQTEGILVPRSAVSMRYENPSVTLKDNGHIIQLLVLGDAGHYVIAAEDDRLVPGTELAPAEGTD